jgi:SulP family sulfate permease
MIRIPMGETRSSWIGDFWGGLSATLVALPSAIAFGVVIYAPLGSSHDAEGALAGILGTIALGLVVPLVGGCNRLITAPSAPAVAMLSAMAVEMTAQGMSPELVILSLMLVSVGCGVLQVVSGAIGLGRLMKYMPYLVVSGFLTAVGLSILASQLPHWLGTPKSMDLWHALTTPSAWSWTAISVGAVTMAVMVTAPRITKKVPAPVLALVAGVAVYFGCGAADHSLLTLTHNRLVIGPIEASAGAILPAMTERWKAIGSVSLAQLRSLLMASLSLAVLLSIDTLKTALALDTIMREHHNSDRTLVGQGAGNLVAALAGGVPGSGAMGPTMVNIAAGAQTNRSALIGGVITLAVFLAFCPVVAWLPIGALAGILIVVGIRTSDFRSLYLLRSAYTLWDFSVIATVVAVALWVGLIPATGAGVGLAILLFLREQIGGTVVYRRSLGNEIYSKQSRLPEQMRYLEQHGDRSVVFELQGSLFFGNTDQLYRTLEPELKQRAWMILDMRRVRSMDLTAVHMLEQIGRILEENHAELILSHLPPKAPTGKDLLRYVKQAIPKRPSRPLRLFAHLSDALEHVEDKLLKDAPEAQSPASLETPLELREIAVFQGRKEETLAALEQCMEKRSCTKGQKLFSRGDTSDELFLIRRGQVQIILPLNGGAGHHLATFGRGDFFGEMAFLDHTPRAADAVALCEADLYVLSRSQFDKLAEEHKRLGMSLLQGVAMILAHRLRRADRELRAFHEG